MTRGALLVIAKAPVPGRVKTRLTPPCTPEQAAALASAALADTVTAVQAAAAGRRCVLVLDGPPAALPGGRTPPGWEVLPQRGEGLAERLASAFADAGAPALLVGMDTPQLTPELLSAGLEALERKAGDAAGEAAEHRPGEAAGARPGEAPEAVFGPAVDGGYWAIGLRAADRRVFAGVPMSVEATGAAQRDRLRELGLRVAELPPLLDVDTMADARSVAALAPASRFAAELARVDALLGAAA